ncbi:MAG TPA: peptidylprolyl isomerase [Tepidisphaeraceae bacterium]|nr:peptidylprolyl isomerase [Tepidisphaeraceae bacterium]
MFKSKKRAAAAAEKHSVHTHTAPAVERLEDRTFLSAATPFKKAPPTQVIGAWLDNRGSALMTTSFGLDINTLSRKTASIYTAGPDAQIGTGDDVRVYTRVGYRKGTLTLNADLAANTPYRVILNSAVIKDVYGRALDGEFKGQGVVSGNGIAGGNFDMVSKTPARTNYRYTAVIGVGQIAYINVAMLTKTATNTVGNFKHYADEGSWDGTFFHRSTRDATSGIQVVQGGGFNVNNQGQIGTVHDHTGIPVQLGNSNVKGTLAMARGPALNSNTNQWFFNVNDNVALDSVGGGYTVFGVVMDARSQAAIEAINNLTIRDANPNETDPEYPFHEIPSIDPSGQIDVPTDLAMITRVAMLMEQAAPSGASPFAARPAAARAATATATATTASPFATTTAPIAPIAATPVSSKNGVLEESGQ